MNTKSIAVAGKGGTGKSTIAALLIMCLKENNMGPVLAIDADPDSNLGSLIGLEPAQTIGDLREDLLKEIKDLPSGMTKANYVELGLHRIIEESEGFDLITMGRGEGPGCYCYLNTLIRKFYNDLMPSYSWVIVDNEAGLEHISRRTSSDVEALVVVVNENPGSFGTAKRIEALTANLDKKIYKKFLVSNMIKGEVSKNIKQKIADLSLEYLCNIPYDKKLEEIVMKGESLYGLRGSPILDKIRLIIDKIGGKIGSS